jgi:hypothetical protein
MYTNCRQAKSFCNDPNIGGKTTTMPSKRDTFIKSRATEETIFRLLMFLGVLGGAWIIYHLAKLALLEINLFIP